MMLQPQQQSIPNQMRVSPVNHQQQQYVTVAQSSMSTTSPITGPAYDLYGMDDFLPIPMEAMIGGSGSGGNSSFAPSVQLCDAARQELISISDRFVIDPDTEMSHDHAAAVIVKCSLRAGDIPQVPPLRLVIPRAYPAGTVSVDRAALDLDSFFFDDLQNVIYDRLSRQSGLRTIADYLNTWESTVRQYYTAQSTNSFEDLFAATNNFDDILS